MALKKNWTAEWFAWYLGFMFVLFSGIQITQAIGSHYELKAIEKRAEESRKAPMIAGIKVICETEWMPLVEYRFDKVDPVSFSALVFDSCDKRAVQFEVFIRNVE